MFEKINFPSAHGEDVFGRQFINQALWFMITQNQLETTGYILTGKLILLNVPECLRILFQFEMLSWSWSFYSKSSLESSA